MQKLQNTNAKHETYHHQDKETPEKKSIKTVCHSHLMIQWTCWWVQKAVWVWAAHKARNGRVMMRVLKKKTNSYTITSKETTTSKKWNESKKKGEKPKEHRKINRAWEAIIKIGSSQISRKSDRFRNNNKSWWQQCW